ncbi:MAG: hypothetical protein M3P94_02980, partial [Chloroflexota bacterium]|nr:hypothetical protein [Chloroflexota bacterium]
ETEHYDVSKKVGEERLFPAVNATATETVIAVAGVSCRQQIEHFTDRDTRHIIEVLADRVAPGHAWQAASAGPVPDEVEPTSERTAHAINTTDGPA